MLRLLALLNPERAARRDCARSARHVNLALCVVLSAMAVALASKPANADLTAAQIVEKHVAARGGVQAWRAVQTLAISGKVDAGSGDSIARSERVAQGRAGPSLKQEHAEALTSAEKAGASPQVQLPFRLELKRPNKSRMEIDFAGKTAVQVFDGRNGWKLRPFLNRDDADPFTSEETKSEAGRGDLEGPLLDYAAKGTKVELVRVDAVEGHDAYQLKLTLKSGEVKHVWIDTQSFLDVKLDGIPRRMDGRLRNVWIYQRDFRSVQGLKVPFVYETVVDGYPQAHSMTVQTFAVNRAVEDSRFAKPQALVAGAAPTAASTGTR